MRRSLTTLAAIAALTALPATAHAFHTGTGSHLPPSDRELVIVMNSPGTVPNPQGEVSVSLDDGSRVGATAIPVFLNQRERGWQAE
jgi:hypothetical protein